MSIFIRDLSSNQNQQLKPADDQNSGKLENKIKNLGHFR
jgi:hypothetical protein